MSTLAVQFARTVGDKSGGVYLLSDEGKTQLLILGNSDQGLNFLASLVNSRNWEAFPVSEDKKRRDRLAWFAILFGLVPVRTRIPKVWWDELDIYVLPTLLLGSPNLRSFWPDSKARTQVVERLETALRYDSAVDAFVPQ